MDESKIVDFADLQKYCIRSRKQRYMLLQRWDDDDYYGDGDGDGDTDDDGVDENDDANDDDDGNLGQMGQSG